MADTIIRAEVKNNSGLDLRPGPSDYVTVSTDAYLSTVLKVAGEMTPGSLQGVKVVSSVSVSGGPVAVMDIVLNWQNEGPFKAIVTAVGAAAVEMTLGEFIGGRVGAFVGGVTAGPVGIAAGLAAGTFVGYIAGKVLDATWDHVVQSIPPTDFINRTNPDGTNDVSIISTTNNVSDIKKLAEPFVLKGYVSNVGDVEVQVPGPTSTSPSTTYTVQPGSRIYGTAANYGLTPTQLESQNNWLQGRASTDKSFVLLKTAEPIFINDPLVTTSVKAVIMAGDSQANTLNTSSIAPSTAEAYIFGGGGNDTIITGNGKATIKAGAGNDNVTTGSGADIIDAGSGDDNVNSGGGDDFNLGGYGNDSIDCGDGNDLVGGGEGNDNIIGGTGDDLIFGDGGFDQGYGNEGNDLLNGGLADDVLSGGDQADTVIGDYGNDACYGDNDPDSIYGGDGDDMTNGGLGDDFMSGGNGRDTMQGDYGNDTMYADADSDVMFGGEGNDIMNAGTGDDTMSAGNGDDSMFADDGNDVMYADGGNDTMDGGKGNDYLNAGLGNDLLRDGFGTNVFQPDAGFDTVYSVNPADTIYYDPNDTVITSYPVVPPTSGGPANTWITRAVSALVGGLNNYLFGKNNPTDTLPAVFQNGNVINFGSAGVGSVSGAILNNWRNPLMLDLNGDGIKTVSKATANINFDMDGDTAKEKTGWASAGDAFVVIDKNNNGKVDNAGEMFGKSRGFDKNLNGIIDNSNELYRVGDVNGFQALKAYDSNNDNVINSSDAQFSLLRVWRDTNQNGVTDTGEMQTLTQAGVKSINLNYQNAFVQNNGNYIAHTSTFTRTNGTTGVAANVNFAFDDTASYSWKTAALANQIIQQLASYGDSQSSSFHGLQDILDSPQMMNILVNTWQV